MNDDDDLWADYAHLAEQADSSQLDDRAWATDDALDALLDRIAAKRPMTASTAANLVGNKARKYRMRRASLIRNAPLMPSLAANENGRFDAIDLLKRNAAVLSTIEARLLFAIGEGRTYGEMALSEGVPEGTIKTWVRRARLKLIR